MECCICMYCSSDSVYFPMLGSCVRLSPEHSLAASAPSPPQGAIEMLLLLHNGKTFEHNACGAASPLCLSKTITSKFSGSSLHLQLGLQLYYVFLLGPHTTWQLYLQGVLQSKNAYCYLNVTVKALTSLI